MKTIKLPITILEEDKFILSEITRIQNSVIRLSYNRFKDKYSEKDVRNYLKDKINYDSWFIQSGIYKAKEMYSKDLEYSKSNNKFPNRVFGGKSNLIKYLEKKISKTEYKKNKLLPLLSIGEAPKYGNRKFNFKDLNSITFKPFKNTKISISFPNIKNNYKKELLNLIKYSNQKKIAYQIQLAEDFIWITFDEIKLKELDLSENKKIDLTDIKTSRYIGIDLNPNFIGFSIYDYNSKKLIHAEQIDLSKLTGKKCDYNKLDHETKEIFHHIGRLCNHYRVNFCFMEDLNFKNGNKGLGKRFNRLTINQWKRNIGCDILKKYFGNKLFKVNAAYSSTIGNCKYGFSDPINASLEIGRRGYEVIILKLRSKAGESRFYPEFDLLRIGEELRKQTTNLELNSWKDLHSLLKNSKVKYRVTLDNSSYPKFFRKFNNIQSRISRCIIDFNGLYNL